MTKHASPTGRPPPRFRSGWRLAGFLALSFLAAISPGLFAQEQASGDTQGLDGLVFRAMIVREDGTPAADAPLIDRLAFADGTFMSEICTRYGFGPAEYWLRNEAGAVRFLAEMHSPSAGTMLWTGRIRGGKLDGTMRWTRSRWYRTIVAEHRISGQQLAEPSD